MKVGFYESDVTPPLGGIMPGYFSARRAITVHDRLYSKACVIEAGGTFSVIISIDTCFVPSKLHDIVTQRIYEYTHISPDCVSITANHTHLGAPISEYALRCCPADETYTDVFYRLVADSAILAYQNLDDAEIFFGTSVVDGISFCRNYIMKDGTYITSTSDYDNISQPLATPDNQLTALFVERDGKKIGAIINYPLHQDTVHPAVLGYSGDYSSVIAKNLKERYGADFVSVFGIGTCGDVNHMDAAKKGEKYESYYYRKIGAILTDGVLEACKNAVPVTGALSSAKDIISVKRRKLTFGQFKDEILSRFEIEEHAMNVGNITAYYMADMPEFNELYIHVIAIGDLSVYLLPGELFTCYGLRIKAESPFKYNMVIENSNSDAGYIPSLKAFDKCSRLYETSPAATSNLISEAGNMITDKALEMANGLFDGRCSLSEND